MTERPGPIDPDLLALLALDAVDDGDERALLDGLPSDHEQSVELGELRLVASWIGATAAEPAPSPLRAAVLQGLTDRPHVALLNHPAPAPLDALAGQVVDFSALLDSLQDDDWTVPTRAGLTVHELVSHLVAIEAYAGDLVGLASFPVDPVGELDHVGMTGPTIERHRAFSPRQTGDEWRRLSTALVTRLRSADLGTRVRFHGLDVSLRTLCTMRTFELWVHGDDILHALGRPAAMTDPGRLHVMGDLAVKSVPLGMLVAGEEQVDATVRFVLTGRSGGVWMQSLGPSQASDPHVVIVVDVEEFCRLVGKRLMPEEVDVHMQGDRQLAERVLHAARVFAA